MCNLYPGNTDGHTSKNCVPVVKNKIILFCRLQTYIEEQEESPISVFTQSQTHMHFLSPRKAKINTIKNFRSLKFLANHILSQEFRGNCCTHIQNRKKQFIL